MPGFLIHVGATVLCSHGGQAQPTALNLRVLVSGQATITRAAPHAVAGCIFNVSGVPCPCVTAQWISSATRVTSFGLGLLLVDSQAVCAPNGTPVVVTPGQIRVTAM